MSLLGNLIKGVEKSSILIIGDGLLGSELKKQNPEWDQISRKQGTLDINSNSWVEVIQEYDLIINCIANTDTYSNDEKAHYKVNVDWTFKLLNICNFYRKKLVHISTDYLYANSTEGRSENDIPRPHDSYYGYTKSIADFMVKNGCDNHLIIRCGHKPIPFPYPKATTKVVGNFDYVDRIAFYISELINNNAEGIYNVGSETKTMYDLAIETNEDVQLMDELPNERMPTDVTMDISKFNNFLKEVYEGR